MIERYDWMNCELYSAEAAHCPMRDFYHLFLPSRQALACNWRLMRAANANGLIQSRLVTRLSFISYAATTQIATENRPNATQPNSCVHHSYFIHFHCQRIKTVSLSGQKKYINWVFTCLWYPFYRVPFQVTFLPFQQLFAQFCRQQIEHRCATDFAAEFHPRFYPIEPLLIAG